MGRESHTDFYTSVKYILNSDKAGGAWLAQSGEPTRLELGAVSLGPTLGVEITSTTTMTKLKEKP